MAALCIESLAHTLDNFVCSCSSYTSPSISFLIPALRRLGGSSQKSVEHIISHLKRLRFGLALSGELRIAAHQRGSFPSKGSPQTKQISSLIFLSLVRCPFWPLEPVFLNPLKVGFPHFQAHLCIVQRGSPLTQYYQHCRDDRSALRRGMCSTHVCLDVCF